MNEASYLEFARESMTLDSKRKILELRWEMIIIGVHKNIIIIGDLSETHPRPIGD